MTVFGDGENGGGQKSIVVVTVAIDKQTGNEDDDGRGGVTTDDDGRGTDGAGGILEDDRGDGILEDVLGGVGETLGIDGLDEEAGAGLVELPPTGPTCALFPFPFPFPFPLRCGIAMTSDARSVNRRARTLILLICLPFSLDFAGLMNLDE